MIKIGLCGQWAIFKYRSTTSSLFQSRCVFVPPPLQLTQIAQSFCSAAEGMNELSVWGGVEVEAVALVVEREVGCG